MRGKHLVYIYRWCVKFVLDSSVLGVHFKGTADK